MCYKECNDCLYRYGFSRQVQNFIGAAMALTKFYEKNDYNDTGCIKSKRLYYYP